MNTHLLFCALFLGGFFCLTHISYAQEREEVKPEYNMPQLAPDANSENMPNTSFLKSYGYDRVTGEPHYFIDTESGLYFDFDEKKVRNFKNGEVYTFEEVKTLLQQKNSKAVEPKNKII